MIWSVTEDMRVLMGDFFERSRTTRRALEVFLYAWAACGTAFTAVTLWNMI